MIGTSVRVRDLKVDEKVRVLSDPELVVVHVVAPRQVEEKPAEEAVVPEEAASAEPEVIRKGKGEEEEEEATEAKKK